MSEQKHIEKINYEVYTDGSCLGNPGIGGYSFVIVSNNKILLKLSGGAKNATNNRMELQAIVQALKHSIYDSFGYGFNSRLKKSIHRKITIYSDSAYCLNSINEGWIHCWEANGWKLRNGDDVKNVDLWKDIYEYITDKDNDITFVKVKGHSGNKYNEIVDFEARCAAERIKRG